MKSLINSMLQVWEAASHDAATLCATNHMEHARDIARASAAARTRGLAFFTLDLPSLDSNLLQLLEQGRVSFVGPFTGRRSKKDTRPRFLHALWSRICDANGCLLGEPDPDAIAAVRQLTSLFKKLEIPCSPNRVRAAVDDYRRIEHETRRPTLAWDEDVIDTSVDLRFSEGFAETPVDELDRACCERKDQYVEFAKRLDRVARILVTELGYFDSMSGDSREEGFFRHGPGAVSNLKGGEYKYSFPSWSMKLEGVFPFDWCSGASLGEEPPSRVEPPAKLVAVPKTAKGPRLIAAEPVEHQWCQQKMFSWLDYAIQHSAAGMFINLHDQTLSQRMVVSASVDRRFATIDLSSASDRMSCWHIERLFSSNKPLLEACHAVRSRRVNEAVTESGEIPLKKFAAMGSALTFPVQCLFFLCVALASAGAYDKRTILGLRGKVRVFGDDIIIPNEAYDACVANLTWLELKVNREKSFSRGAFRESCGADYWGGFNVTPVKPKHMGTDTVKGIESLLDASNNLFLAGYWRASAVILEMIPAKFKRNIFSVHDPVPGVKSFAGRSLGGKTHWDENLHVTYVNQPIFVRRQKRITPDNSTTLREFHTRPWSALRPRELGVVRVGEAAYVASTRVEISGLA